MIATSACALARAGVMILACRIVCLRSTLLQPLTLTVALTPTRCNVRWKVAVIGDQGMPNTSHSDADLGPMRTLRAAVSKGVRA